MGKDHDALNYPLTNCNYNLVPNLRSNPGKMSGCISGLFGFFICREINLRYSCCYFDYIRCRCARCCCFDCPDKKDNESNDDQELVGQGNAVDSRGSNVCATMGSANRPAAGII